MPSYAKFMKELLSKKRKLENDKTVPLTEEYSAILQRKLSQKLKDPGSFSIPCAIGNCTMGKALCDLGASINLMHLAIMKRLGIEEVKPTSITLQLTNKSYTYPYGIVEDLLVKIDKFIFLADFVILDMEVDADIPLILGRPFLAIGRALIGVQKGELMLRVHDEKVIFNVIEALKHPNDYITCIRVDILDSITFPHFIDNVDEISLLKETIVIGNYSAVVKTKEHLRKYVQQLDTLPIISSSENSVREELKMEIKEEKVEKLELKQLPSHLRYSFLGQEHENLVIINNDLKGKEEEKLLRILIAHKSAIGWHISDLKGINPSFCKHRILFEDNYKPVV
ncbi:uncharacterized protein LOC113874302 [Abrus precatorius]|uniref:Uncharacterized protein LOC113874302 n=1 Tax=Abrus precatorius TaxID=3816 RepID=A0A8B8MKA7_ABRPR|nr:uncharacterized protein LOC113874302 [Abrus precatorius]